jgi:steroid Delta-isomerase
VVAAGRGAPIWPIAASEGEMASLSETDAAILAARHAQAFNDAVAAGDFAGFLAMFADDAVITFENVPGAGELVFTGREEYAGAYARQPPDDQIDITGSAEPEDGGLVVPFAWRHDRAQGTLHLQYSTGNADDLDERLITKMTVVFG